MPQLLVELLSGEIPARMQERACTDFKRLVCSALIANGIVLGEEKDIKTFSTPRRLTLVIHNLPAMRPVTHEEKRGPRVDASTQAIEGFLKDSGLKFEQLSVRQTEKGQFYFATITRQHEPTAILVKEVIESVLSSFPWPKSMRWGSDRRTYWIRPLQRILCLFNKEIIPVQFAGISASNMTEGHRFLAPITFPVRNFDCYERGLRETFVILDSSERIECILKQANKLASSAGLEVKTDTSLLKEIAGLVEWPSVLMGHIDNVFMDIPEEVLMAAMRTRQKYISLLRDGHLAPYFLAVSNITPPQEKSADIVVGNERVLRARLSDAKFFWDHDRTRSLHKRIGGLTECTFHTKLGTMAEKVERVRKLVVVLAELIPDVDPTLVDRAALLSKADLSTDMVSEFPELQGIIGRYYAQNDRENPAVCDAIAEHYAPLGKSDRCPSAPISVCLALSDKIDTLVAFWLLGEKPSGSKDPFALRRTVLGVIRLLVENKVRIGLLEIFSIAFTQIILQGKVTAIDTELGNCKIVSQDLLDFFFDRLKVHLRERGMRHDLIAAIFAQNIEIEEDDLVRILARADALSRFLATDDGKSYALTCRRVMNILHIEENRSKASYHGPIDERLLCQQEERTLQRCLSEVVQISAAAISEEKFYEAMLVLARLRLPVDAFFENVTVNSRSMQLRENRLRLLSQVRAAMQVLADFSKIEG